MTKNIHFNEALDYIFITNDSGKNSYLITGDIGLTSAVSVKAAATATVAIMGASTMKHSIQSTTGSIQSSMTELHPTSGGVTAVTVDNIYDITVNLGAMLINNTMLFDNGSDLVGMNIGTFFDDPFNVTELNTTFSIRNMTNNEDDFTNLLKMVATSAVLGLMILITIIGNVFVIAAIILERNLQNVANYLVASLAVADLFVACLVMPLGAVYEISEGWILGPELCDIWTMCDVLCCTASILHLVAIAVDRYWAVTNIDYIHSRTSRRVLMMIICVWSAAVIVSLAPQFGWKDPDYLQRIEQQKCMVSQDVAYQVFATCCTFYVPLFVILVLYWKIYQTARKRIHRRRPKPLDGPTDKNNKPNICLKKRKHLRLRLGKFSTTSKSDNGNTVLSGKCDGNRKGENELGLVEGNSTNTINTVEDTEFSSSNVDGKSRAGIEIISHFRNTEELDASTSEVNEITTVSNLVALANQQHSQTILETTTEQQNPDKNFKSSLFMEEKSKISKIKGPKEVIEEETTNKATNVEVIQEPHLHIQLQETQQHSFKVNMGTSNATTTTSISAISPGTPPTLIAPTYSHNSQLSSSVNMSSQVTPIASIKTTYQQQPHLSNPVYKMTKRKETLEAKRERKAAKTLAIITGAFVVCWLPFFVMALMMPLCTGCQINDSIASFFLWLGYFNSTLNPVIYTIFSPEFRQAFKRILFGGHKPVHYRSGKI